MILFHLSGSSTLASQVAQKLWCRLDHWVHRSYAGRCLFAPKACDCIDPRPELAANEWAGVRWAQLLYTGAMVN